MPLRWYELGCVFADRLIGGVAKYRFSAMIPGEDVPGQAERYDAIFGGFENRCKETAGFFRSGPDLRIRGDCPTASNPE